MNISHLPWRVAGVLLVGVGMVLFEPGSSSIVQRLLLPLLFGLSAGLITQNLLAVCLTGAVLGIIHTDLSQVSWIDRFAYPAIAAVCVLTLTALYMQRGRKRIRETHSERWSARSSDS
ncbi:MAG: hypothetical protein O3A63_00755 [Proteobacteria bacterium]|nr:hypothetical protein [Pseudomonadota bacterium]